jgi:predicted TIM-barrel fold metal-dependent hydrolase
VPADVIDAWMQHPNERFMAARWLWNLPPNDRRYHPVYIACVEQDVPFRTQIGHTGPLCPSEPGRPIPYPDEALHGSNYPSITAGQRLKRGGEPGLDAEATELVLPVNAQRLFRC